jgi:hypothetical protein
MLGQRVHDRAILDALETIGGSAYDGKVWRVAKKGRDALLGSTARGRWSPTGEFEVLYTSLERNGALAEVGFRLSLEPIWPSRIKHVVHEITVRTERTLRLASIEELKKLGVETSRYGSFDYTATQAVAAAAHFLEFDGIISPSARFPCANLALFLDRISENTTLEVDQSEDVDWEEWQRTSRANPGS